MSYIRNHVNTPLSLDDVAASIGRSVSYTGNLFKKETGQTLGNYIAECRLEEAKSLLYYTDMTLAEISSYLCFSSQSYFQNVFKKNMVLPRCNIAGNTIPNHDILLFLITSAYQ